MAAVLRALRRKVIELDDIKTDDRRKELAIAIKDDIAAVDLSTFSQLGIAELYATCFQTTPPSILAYLRNASPEQDAATTPALLGALVVAVDVCPDRDMLGVYANAVVDCCLGFISKFKHSAFKKATEAAAELIAQLLSRQVQLDPRRVETLFKSLDLLLASKREKNEDKRTLFELSGALCRHFAIEADRLINVRQLINLLLAELRKNVNSMYSTPTLTVVVSNVRGLSGMLFHFSHLCEGAGNNSLEAIYNLTKVWLNPNVQLKRFGPVRAILLLYSEHAALFAEQLLKEYALIYGWLCHWTTQTEKELKKAAFMATDAFLEQVAERFPDVLRRNRNDAEAMLQYFVSHFERVLFARSSVETASMKSVSAAVKGLGKLSRAIGLINGDDAVNKLLQRVAERAEQLFVESQEPIENRIFYLPQFIDSLSLMLRCATSVQEEFWLCVERLQLLYFHHFPVIDFKQHYRSALVTYQLLVAALPHRPSFVDHLIRQTLLRIASTPVGGNEAKVSVTDYLPLWTHLSGRSTDDRLDKSEREHLCALIFHATISAIVSIVESLDLTIGKSDDESIVPSDPTTRNDFLVFGNLVNFFCAFLDQSDGQLFACWVWPLSQKFVLLAAQFPFASGLYRMLSATVTLARKSGYFDSALDNDVRQCQHVLSQFADEALRRVASLKDDHLFGVLHFILALPSQMIADKVDSVAVALTIALKLGHSYLPLAATCLDALELWIGVLDKNKRDQLCSSVLPVLDDYLTTESAGNEEKNSLEADKRRGAKATKEAQNARQRGQIARLSTEDAQMISLPNLRRRIALFLGDIGGCLNKFLLTGTADETLKAAIAWDTSRHLPFDVPFSDAKVRIELDRFLPHICELATISGNRQCKTAAAECLHSVVVYAMGRHGSLTDQEQDRQPMNKLYRLLFPYLLRLCCDADEVPKQLFRPLVTQIIHWFSANQSYENRETVALIDSLMEAVIDSSDASMREYAANCIDEFLKWTIKQNTARAHKDAMRNNAKSVMKRVCNFAEHPDPLKRLGAAVAFNAFYRTLRESAELVDEFGLDLLSVYFRSLSMAHNDPESAGTAEQCSLSITHLQRIVLGRDGQKSPYFDRLMTASKSRRLPKEWTAATVRGALSWLIGQIARPEAEFRRKAWEFVLAGGRLIDGSLKTNLDKLAGVQSVSDWVAKFERNLHPAPRTTQLSIEWFEVLEATVDCFLMFLTNGYSVKLTDALSCSRNLIPAMETFLRIYVIGCDGDDDDDDDEWLQEMSAFQRTRFNKIKCTVVVRILSLIQTIVSLGSAEGSLNKIAPELWTDVLWHSVVRICANPASVGFDMTDKNVLLNLPLVVKETCRLFAQKLPPNIRAQCHKSIDNQLRKQFPLDESVLNLFAADGAASTDQVSLALRREDAHFILADLKLTTYPLDPERLWRRLIDACFNSRSNIVQFPPVATDLANKLISSAIRFGLKMSSIVSSICDQSRVVGQSGNGDGAAITKGSAICQRFAGRLTEAFASAPGEFFDCLLNASDLTTTIDTVVHFLDHLGKNDQLRQRLGKRVNEAIASRWNIIEKASPMNCCRLLTKMVLVNSEFATVSSKFNDETKKTIYHVPDNFAAIFDKFCAILVDHSITLSEKNKALVLLGIFALIPNGSGDPEVEMFASRLKNSLETFVSNDLPIVSSEFAEGTAEYSWYLSTMQLLLRALTLSNSSIVLHVLVSILCREKAHIARDEISYMLNRYARRLPPSVMTKQLEVPLLVVLNESLVGVSGEQLRLNTLDRVLLPMLDGLSSENLMVFFIDQVVQLTAALASPILTDTALTTKIGCYKLLQVMYERLDVTVLKGAINRRYAPDDSDTALLRELVRCSKMARAQFADDLSARKWQYRCAAQNCLMAVVCKTQTNPDKIVNFFKEYLFPADVWRYMADDSHSYSFDTEVEQLPQRQKMLLRLRKAMLQGSDADLMIPMSRGNSTLGFLSSQVLASSSLHSQVSSTSQYDFTMSDSQDATGDVVQTTRMTSLNNEQDQIANDDEESEVLAMEMDELNSHPCMQPLVTAMRHFCQMGDAVYDKTGAREPPQWMQNMWEQLDSTRASVNVKLLVWRLVGHLEQEFRPYAKRWLPPLIKSLSDQSLGGAGLHYFRVDTLVTCLSWATTATPSAGILHDASRLLAFLIERAAHDNSVVLRRNVRLVQLMCELWKGLSYRQRYLSEQLIIGSKNNETATAVTVAALQLAAVLIQNDVDPLAAFEDDQEDYDGKRKKFYDSLLPVYFLHKSSKVRVSAAELIGVAFAYYNRRGTDPMRDFPSVKHDVTALKLIEESRFLRILAAISRHYPKFVAPFKTDVCSLLARVHGDYKAVSLELACALAADRELGELRELPLPTVRQMMTKSTDPAVRECALRLIKLLTNGKLSTDVIADLVPDIVSFVDYHHLPCRNTMVDTCIILYDEHKNEATTNEHSAKILSLTKDCLLRCLSDPDSTLKQKVCNFWSHESRLPGDLTGRSIGLLQLAFSSSSDRQFLSDATYLLLERCAKSPDFERSLFDNPLSRCDFQNIEVVTSWRRRNEALQTPVFAMTQKTSGAMSQFPATLAGVSGLETMQTQRDGDQHRLRATQAGGALKFEQTLTQGQHFDWLSGNTYDENTLFGDSPLARFGEQTVPIGGQRTTAKRKLRPVDAQFGRKLGLSQSAAVVTDSDTIDELRRMKRRILKDRKKTNELYANSGMRIQQRRRLAEKEQRAASGQTVQLYRTYRYGDFPDVQIPCRAVVAPLQALAKSDARVAGLLFESLLDGVHQLAIDAGDEDWRSRLQAAIQDILRQSFVYGPVVSALLSFCHRRAEDLLIEPTLVASAGIGSNQQMAAIAVLEHYLEVRLWDRGGPTGKRRRPNDARSSDDEAKVWLELVKVYKSIGDADMMRGIFEKKLNCLAPTKLGLEAEFRHDYDTAINFYAQALKEMDEKEGLQSDFEFSEQQLVEESRLKCLDTLGDWSSITRIVGQMVDSGDGQNDTIDFDGVWTMTEEESSSTLEERKKMCLSYLMRSNVRLLLQLNDLEQTLRKHVQTFVDAERRWESDDEKRSFLESHFATDMALRSFVWQLNDEAAGHLASALNNFLVEWPQVPKMLDGSRRSLLAALQPIAHTFAYLNFVKSSANFNDLSSLATLCARWRDAAVDELTELNRWDDAVSGRCWFVMNISERMTKTVDKEAVYQVALPAEIGDRLRYARAASAGGCYSLAEDQLKVARKLLKGLNDKQLSAEWTHTYARVHLSNSANRADGLGSVVEQVGKAAELLSQHQSQHPGDEETIRLMGEACWRLAEQFLVLDVEHWKELSEETKITAIQLAGLANDEQISFGRITSGLLNRADSCLERAAEARIDDSAVMTFANFCDFYINEKRKSDEQGKKSASLRTKRNADDYAQSMVGALFEAMRIGSAKARQLFPKLLNVIETFPDCRSTFTEQAKTVPTWMFLGWLNQIIALLDSPSATALHDIVQRLSDEYPQAVFYPFNVSRKQWTATDYARKAFVEKLDGQFEKMTMLKTLVKALDLLSPPELLVRAFNAELTLAQAQNPSASTLAELRSKTDELCRELFVAIDECGLPDYESAQPGKFWKDFCNKHYPQFREEFGDLGANIGDLLAKKQAKNKLSNFQSEMRKDSTVEDPPGKLDMYSKWLANFNAADYEIEVEIPGQYVGDKMPDVDAHVKICSFDERVAVFRSLSKPKAITIRGNDGREYRYLVKGGEDLRQDERIQQLFDLINGLLDADSECKKRHLRIQTYRVVPLSPRLGILQFVPNAKSLAEFLNEQMNGEERTYHGNSSLMWKKFYHKECINCDVAVGSAFDESVVKFSPDKAVECLRKARKIFRPNLLRSGVEQLCWDSTGAVLVQREMTRSHAVLCVAHYLLGIGDRHLKNTMIDVSTGRMIGIDFGYAFGISILLDVPELIPFRLSRQFVVAMGPLGVDGHFTSAMRLCLRALRSNKQLLLNTMDVFVREPSMNWMDQARLSRLRGNAPADADDSWYPKQKLDIAALKLTGRNPVLITCEELKLGKKRKSDVADRLNMILCGRNEKTWNEKKDMASPRDFPKDLTVDQQTDCLVELATDDAVLSRIYFGWEPWL